MSCASLPEPEWVTTQPQVEGYWVGIGTVQKPFYGNDCREEARNKALAEISSQISVQISGSFKRVVEEHNLNLDEITKSVIQTRVDNNLPNIEPIDFFDNKDRCGLLLRLSKTVYYKTIEQQRYNAVQSALGLLNKAEAEFNVQSFTYLSEAMNEIVPYMDVPIDEEYPIGSGKLVNLYSYIKILANTFINRISLILDQETVIMKLGFKRDIQLGVQVQDNINNTPIKNVPVICYIDENKEESFALSDAEGDCIFPIPPIKDNKSIQYVNFEVNMDKIIDGTQLFGTLSHQQAQTILQIYPPQIYIQISENNLGESTVNPYIQPVITEFFAQHFSANFVETNNADLIINGLVNTRAVSDMPNEYGIYLVFGDVTVSISNGITGEQIIEKSYNKVQGSNFQSNKEAANQSLKKISEKITEEFLPELVELIKGK